MAIVNCLIVGAGVFGITGAIELRRRGHRVTLVDPGPLPHPRASSTDISKIVRMDYGADEFYTRLMERAMDGWRAYNEFFSEPLYHEIGFCILSSTPLTPGSFEGDSYALLRRRGHSLQRLDRRAIAERFPLWRTGRYVDGYFNARAGWAESGRVVTALLAQARALGVEVRPGVQVRDVLEAESRVTGVRSTEGERLTADVTVIAAGAWTTLLVPALSKVLATVGQTVLHLRPTAVAECAAPALVPWAADIQKTGFYGFPSNRDGLVKIANHGPGLPVDPRDERQPPADADDRFRAFLRQAMPDLADAPIVGRRLCLYSDSRDSNFVIARDPERPGLTVAAGGSGHGFKFAPVLGQLIAGAVTGDDNPWAKRFAWRTSASASFEDARHHQ